MTEYRIQINHTVYVVMARDEAEARQKAEERRKIAMKSVYKTVRVNGGYVVRRVSA